MIQLTRLNGDSFTLNALYIEKVQSFPDTTITLTNGNLIVVKEHEQEVTQKALDFYRKINMLAFERRLEGQ